MRHNSPPLLQSNPAEFHAMKNLLQIASGLNVLPLRLQLQRNQHLWNRNTIRTENPTSPHHGCDDIWVRHLPEGKNSHADSEWMLSAQALPAAADIAFGLMSLVKGERLGGVLITRIPPGHAVRPHIDRGWHAEYYDKFAVQIASHQQQAFCFEGESLCAAPGDVYWFDNSKEHWVENNSPVERITLIVCIKPHTSLEFKGA